MDAATRNLVRERAGGVCEYCRLPQSVAPLVLFHIEHITARQHRGSDDPANLALSCQQCNLHKGPNLAGIDPETSALVRLFDPRRDVWHEHFLFQGNAIVGLTPVGRASVRVLAMNSAIQLATRSDLG